MYHSAVRASHSHDRSCVPFLMIQWDLSEPQSILLILLVHTIVNLFLAFWPGGPGSRLAH